MSATPISANDFIAEGNRNYDLGHDHAKEELRPILSTLEVRHAELYRLVEAYLTTPNTNPAVVEAYDNLVAWFVKRSRPDGSPPLPIAHDN